MNSPIHTQIFLVAVVLLVVGSSCKPQESYWSQRNEGTNSQLIRAKAKAITIKLIAPTPDDCVAEVRNPTAIDILLGAIIRVKQARYDGRSEHALGAPDGIISASGETVLWQGPTISPRANDRNSHLNYVIVQELHSLSSTLHATDISGNCTNWQRLVSEWEARIADTNKPPE